MPRGGDTSQKAKANGKASGRPRKPKVEQRAEKSVANAVLDKIDEIAFWLFLLRADVMADPEKRKTLSFNERIQVKQTLEYLTNRRDGKPAESIISEGKMVIEVIERSGTSDNSATEAGALKKTLR